MKTPQSFIKLIAPNKRGMLAAVSRELAGAGVNIEEIHAVEAGKHVIILLAVSEPKKAVRVLQESGYHILEEKGIIVKIKDAPGALAEVAERLAQAGVDLTSTNDVGRSGGHAFIALSTTDPAQARRALRGMIV